METTPSGRLKSIVLTSASQLTKLVYTQAPGQPIRRSKYERDDCHREEWSMVGRIGMFKERANKEITELTAKGWRRE